MHKGIDQIFRPRNRQWQNELLAMGLLFFMGCFSYFVLMIGARLVGFFDAANQLTFQQLVHRPGFFSTGAKLLIEGYGSLYVYSGARHVLRSSKSVLIDNWLPWFRK